MVIKARPQQQGKHTCASDKIVGGHSTQWTDRNVLVFPHRSAHMLADVKFKQKTKLVCTSHDACSTQSRKV